MTNNIKSLFVAASLFVISGCATSTHNAAGDTSTPFYGCVVQGRFIKPLEKQAVLRVMVLLENRVELDVEEDTDWIPWTRTICFPSIKGCEGILENQWLLSAYGHIMPCNRFAQPRIYKLSDDAARELFAICNLYGESKQIENLHNFGGKDPFLLENLDQLIISGVLIDFGDNPSSWRGY